MNLRFKKGILFVVSWIIASAMMAQTIELRGKVTDARTSEPLPFVNIGIKDQAKGTFSDSNGWYHVELIKGNYVIFFSSVGYDRYETEVKADGKKSVDLDIKLTPSSQELNTVVVSGSKYAQKIQESISTIEVIKAKSIDISNIPTVDKAVDRVPGVAIIDNEPQIRGGSGFSSGLGSRVMI
ncbi:MAG: carboxypeptidase-like regulatory domain-containing protein, partial [Bacteroidota bacterium]